ncbi:MAG TPA: endonuclease domain-containing protein [Bacteroidota bacterium]|nr:endonuclease domain-containing protein [Bacteroidota bacterium]
MSLAKKGLLGLLNMADYSYIGNANIGQKLKQIELAKQLARDLRKRQTQPEEILWERVRDRKFEKVKFYRQHPLFFHYEGRERFFISDFYAHIARLVIEIDGKIHDYQKDYDELRSIIIGAFGIEVVRFKNQQITDEIEAVMLSLSQRITDRVRTIPVNSSKKKKSLSS